MSFPGRATTVPMFAALECSEEGIYYANHVVNPFFYEGMKAYIYEVYRSSSDASRSMWCFRSETARSLSVR